MDVVAKILVGLVALEHVYILYMEMFLWATPRVMKTFGTTPQFAQESKTLAANQGLCDILPRLKAGASTLIATAKANLRLTVAPVAR